MMNSSPRTATPVQWVIRDLVVSIFIILFLTLGTVMILAPILSPSHLVASAMDISIDLLVSFYLWHKYPLQLWTTVDGKLVIKYILVGGIVCLLVNFPYKIWAGNFKAIPHEYTQFANYNFFEKGLFLLMLCLLVPLSEEILFRGFFYRIIKNRYNILWGTLVSTTVFTAFHGLSLKNLIYIAVPSLVFTFVYEKSGSIWSSIFAHALNNTLWFVFVYWGMISHIR